VTRSTDVGEIWHGGVEVHSSMLNFTCIGAQIRYGKFYKNFTKFQNINMLLVIFLVQFCNISRVCIMFQDTLAVKIWMESLNESQSYGGFKLRMLGFPHIFSAFRVKLCDKPLNVLAVQECAWGPLSPCQVWWSMDFA